MTADPRQARQGAHEAKAALLRLRFASLDQLRAHLHIEDNATLLFFRDAALKLAAGATALIELVFDTSEETRVVRTTVLARARVVWSEGGEAGLEFDRREAACRAALAKLFQVTEARWRYAREARHPETCCRGGALLEPPVPRVRVDGKQPVLAAK